MFFYVEGQTRFGSFRQYNYQNIFCIFLYENFVQMKNRLGGSKGRCRGSLILCQKVVSMRLWWMTLKRRIICNSNHSTIFKSPFFSSCCSSQIHTKLVNDVRTFYFGENGTVGKDSLVEYNDMLSDMWMVVDIDRSAKLHAAKSHGKTFYYRFVLNIYMSLYHSHPIPSPPTITTNHDQPLA